MSNAMDKQRRVLGKGLSALLPGRGPQATPSLVAVQAAATAPAPDPSSPPNRLPIDAIHPNPVQPRIVFRADRLEELAASIRANGIIQPLIVR